MLFKIVRNDIDIDIDVKFNKKIKQGDYVDMLVFRKNRQFFNLLKQQIF